MKCFIGSSGAHRCSALRRVPRRRKKLTVERAQCSSEQGKAALQFAKSSSKYPLGM